MDACMNKEKQVTEYQQAAKAATEYTKEKKAYTRHRNILKFCLIPCPHSPQMTCNKHRWMNHLIQVQGKN